MLANDRLFDSVGGQLDSMNDMFTQPDYINRYAALRAKVITETGKLTASLRAIQEQIDALREAAALSKDPDAVKQMREAAAQLQDAYLHQYQLSNDLTNMARVMIDYDISEGKHYLDGWNPEDQAMPEEAKKVRVYVHFDKQRTSMTTAEDRAVDIAYTIAQTRCTTGTP
jgi:hypothetical protein